MGPTILCDKCTIQSLKKASLDLLHHYFSVNIPPILVIEILGDLKKKQDSEKAQKDVRDLAGKLTALSVIPNASFRQLIEAELRGAKIELHGRPVIHGATKIVTESGEVGAQAIEDPHEMALQRWREGEFSAAEQALASLWRLYTKEIGTVQTHAGLESTYSAKTKPKRSLTETLQFTDDIVGSAHKRVLFAWFLEYLEYPLSKHDELLDLLSISSSQNLSATPFTEHCVRVSIFGHFAMRFGLTSAKPTNRLDLEYLFYLPFCNAFSTADRFSRRLAPLLLNEAQVFVDSERLKNDLDQTAEWLASLDANERQTEMQSIGPPERAESVCYELWLKFMKKGYRSRPRLRLTPDMEGRLLARVKEFMTEPSTQGAEPVSSLKNLKFVSRTRSLRINDPCPCRSGKAFKDCHGIKP